MPVFAPSFMLESLPLSLQSHPLAVEPAQSTFLPIGGSVEANPHSSKGGLFCGVTYK